MAAGGQAELIYVRGPQEGQRASLMSAVVSIGRGQQADVQLAEEHVSRKHFQLTLTQDGWVFENQSPLKSRINGKKCKIGKKIILDTGDVVAVGLETELLFVATGDDPEAALIAYRSGTAKTRQAKPASAPPAAPAAGPQGDDEQSGALEQIEPASPEPNTQEPEEVELDDEEQAILAQKAKIKKFATIFGVYIGVLAVAVIIFISMRGPGDITKPGESPKLLSRDQIAEYIRTPIIRDNNVVAAREALAKAVEILDRTNRADHLYQAIFYFKLSQAYGKVLNTKNETQFKNARERLTEVVQEKYRNAYALRRNHQYVAASRIFRQLLEMLPSMEHGRDRDGLRANIIAQVAFIRREAVKDSMR
jgi:pSer/pThr/pTyr-binding forkhead associated (FHA) protein